MILRIWRTYHFNVMVRAQYCHHIGLKEKLDSSFLKPQRLKKKLLT